MGNFCSFFGIFTVLLIEWTCKIALWKVSEGICHFHARAIGRRRKTCFHLRMNRILFAAKHIAHWQTVICRQLIAGHVMGFGPTKREKNLQRMIIIRYSTSSSRWLGSAVETAFICRWIPFSVNKRNHCVQEPILRMKTGVNNTVNN